MDALMYFQITLITEWFLTHTSQENGCSTKWMRWCLLKEPLWLYDFLQILQANCRLPPWMHWCVLRWHRRLNDLLHTSQEYGRSTLCTDSCSVTVFFGGKENGTVISINVNRKINCLKEMCKLYELLYNKKRVFFTKYQYTSGARGSVVGWGTMLQAGRSRVRVPMRWIFFNLPNSSSRTMALGSTQPLTEMSTRKIPGG
jgi:hypothetical protein